MTPSDVSAGIDIMLLGGTLTMAGLGAASTAASGIASKTIGAGTRVVGAAGRKGVGALKGSVGSGVGSVANRVGIGGVLPQGFSDGGSSNNRGHDNSMTDAPQDVPALPAADQGKEYTTDTVLDDGQSGSDSAGDVAVPAGTGATRTADATDERSSRTSSTSEADAPDDGQTGADSTGTVDDAAVAAGTEATQTGDSTDERASTGGSPGSPPPDDGETGAGDDAPSTRDLEQRITALEAKIDSLAGEDETPVQTATPDSPDTEQSSDDPSDDGLTAADLDPDAMDEDEFVDAYTSLDEDEQAKFVRDQLGGTGNRYLEAFANDAAKGAITGAAGGVMLGGVGAIPGAVMGAFAGGMKGVAGKGMADVVRKQRSGETFTQSIEDVSGDILGEAKQVTFDYSLRDHLTPGSVTRESSESVNTHDKYD
ncbi:hypothetical protein [Halococcoides cellulosivorans]|uniref:Glycine zipper domain-containing protein n=1 Tax=Halococcoides cellulosivorans TaxID=1679096 RepID=A0A2R4WYV6_9EURY|nr:hypothetical protein [Halococcoides cellulosivorans]AWB26723.1 hypothetical protein HARCEL1_02830 [Halococcoides cellulosivorans]